MGLGLGLGVAAMAQMRSADGTQSGFGGQQAAGFGGAGMDSSFTSQDVSRL